MLKRTLGLTSAAVVALSVVAGLCGIKDGNLVQSMQAAQSASVDGWNEYQATKTKQHLAETSRTQIAALATDPAKAGPALAALDQ